MKLYLSPNPDKAGNDSGVGKVVQAQYKYLPGFGIEFVSDPAEADLTAAHIASPFQVDVLHCHGLYWTGDQGGKYENWHSDANRAVLNAAKGAIAVTVPSNWVAEPFRRDMRINPVVIGHGLDLAEWKPLPLDKRLDYILWNKNREGDVCDPAPAIELARRGLPVISTFGDPAVMQVIGKQPFSEMKEYIRHAGVYLATTKETFGIGILEALACGVPVLGYKGGGIDDLIQHRINGWLVEPGNIDGLVEGYKWLMGGGRNVDLDISAAGYDWPVIIERYANLYQEVFERKQKPAKVAVVITNHNYGQYVNKAVQSCVEQTRKPEIIVVDDASTDDSQDWFKTWQNQEIEVIANETNKGVAFSRNLGISRSNADFIICLDADDYLEADYVETCAAAMERDRSLGVVYTGLKIHFPDGSASVNPWPPKFDFDIMTQPTNPPSNCVPCAAMFRRSMWERGGGYLQSHAPAEDTEFFLRGLSTGFNGLKVTDRPLFNYRVHENSASKTKTYKPVDTWHPWMRDYLYPMAAPVSKQPKVRSYSNPAISVIIPVGPGHAKFLPDALNSVLGQTFRDWEVIVIDDTKTFGNDLADLHYTYPFVKFWLAEEGRGAGYARNIGLEHAKAPLSIFLDADDWLAPQALEKMVKAYLEAGGKKYVYSDWVAYEQGKPPSEQHTLEYQQELWLDKMHHAVTALVETEVARSVGFDPGLETWEDWEFFTQFAVKGYCGVRVPEPLLIYRVHTGMRRDVALKNMDKYRAEVLEIFKGVQIMACGSCGGSANTLSQIQTAAEWSQAQLEAARPKEQDGRVLMEYTGANTGGIPWYFDGVQYVGANDNHNKFVQALPQHVDRLLQTGRWQIAS